MIAKDFYNEIIVPRRESPTDLSPQVEEAEEECEEKEANRVEEDE